MPKPSIERVKVETYPNQDIPLNDLLTAIRVVRTFKEYYTTNPLMELMALSLVDSQFCETYNHWERQGLIPKETINA